MNDNGNIITQLLRERLPCRPVFLTTIFQFGIVLFGCTEMLFVVFMVSGGASAAFIAVAAPFASIVDYYGFDELDGGSELAF